MELELSYLEALTFRRTIGALRSICRDVRVSAHLNSLHLEGLNDSRTAWMQIAFSRCFFSSFRVSHSKEVPAQLLRRPGPPDAPSDGTGTETGELLPRFQATVNVRHLLKAIGKGVPAAGGGTSGGRGVIRLERLRIRGISFPSSHPHQARQERRSGCLALTFIFRDIPIGQTVLLPAMASPHTLPGFIRWRRRHTISMPPRSWLELLDEYLHNSENVTLVHDVPGDAVKVQSDWHQSLQQQQQRSGYSLLSGTTGFVADQNTLHGMYGEIVLERSHFEHLSLDGRLPAFSHITFSSRELRATAALCDQLGAPLTLVYRGPRRPVVCCFGAVAHLSLSSPPAPGGSVCSGGSGWPSAYRDAFVPHWLLSRTLRHLQEQQGHIAGCTTTLDGEKALYEETHEWTGGNTRRGGHTEEGEGKVLDDGPETSRRRGVDTRTKRLGQKTALRERRAAFSRAWAGFVWISTSPLGIEDGDAVDDDVSSVTGDDYADYIRLHKDLEQPSRDLAVTHLAGIETSTEASRPSRDSSSSPISALVCVAARCPPHLDSTPDETRLRMQAGAETVGMLAKPPTDLRLPDRVSDSAAVEKQCQTLRTSREEEERYRRSSEPGTTAPFSVEIGAELLKEGDMEAISPCPDIMPDLFETENFRDTSACVDSAGTEVSTAGGERADQPKSLECDFLWPRETRQKDSNGQKTDHAEGGCEAVSPESPEATRELGECALRTRGLEPLPPRTEREIAPHRVQRESPASLESVNTSHAEKTDSLGVNNGLVWEQQAEWVKSGGGCAAGVSMYAKLTTYASKLSNNGDAARHSPARSATRESWSCGRPAINQLVGPNNDTEERSTGDEDTCSPGNVSPSAVDAPVDWRVTDADWSSP